MKTKAAARSSSASTADVESVLAALKRLGSKKIRDEMEPRYGIVAPKAYGVRMSAMQRLAKDIGRDHRLAQDLWKTGWYEARTVAAFLAEPERLTPALMDRWCRDFDNWAICDTICFHLFDRSPHAFDKVAAWASSKDEFVKRAAFALLASLALHDKAASDAAFARCLPLIEKAATDERNFVKKSVSWALRSIGRRSRTLHAKASALAARLAASENATARWIGRDAVKDLAKPALARRFG